jgi:hypothetical protein
MAIKNLVKEFRIIWKNNLEITQNLEKEVGSTTGVNDAFFNSFEADTKEEIDAKIAELNLVETNDF